MHAVPSLTDSVLEDLSAAVASHAATDQAPAVVVGVVADGSLIAVFGHGETTLGSGEAPDADTAFRIASMTKSFTAATLLSLRDAGVLSLEDPVRQWLPHLVTSGPSEPLTLRHLLSMSAGFPTDDPWGDRQQAMAIEQLDDLMRAGFTRVYPPGTEFEYSNLGYALLGRVVAMAAGSDYAEAVRERILQPLGLTATGFAPEDLARGTRVATGYVPRGDPPELVAEPAVGYGAFAPMGGLFSTVRDLATWVGGFLSAEGESGIRDGHPLSAFSRREMGQTHRLAGATYHDSSDSASMTVSGYGFGLVEDRISQLGRVVSHSGGYPGFGSHMRWHPGSGVGIIGLSNRTYAPMRRLTVQLLASAVRSTTPSVSHYPHSRRLSRTPQRMHSAVAAMDALVRKWDDAIADSWFADNVDLDVPREERLRQLDAARDAVGELRPAKPDGTVGDETTQWQGGDDDNAPTPAHYRWSIQGERGRLRVSVLLTPTDPMLVQNLQVSAVPHPAALLLGYAGALLAAAMRPSPNWPETVPRASGVDPADFQRQARWLASRVGEVELGEPVSGDGVRVASWLLTSGGGPAQLSVQVDDTDAITQVGFTLAPVVIT